jgi:putative FmdB family regulatory protein
MCCRVHSLALDATCGEEDLRVGAEALVLGFLPCRCPPARAGTRAAATVETAMPTYQYRCAKCGELFEHVEHVAEHETVHLRCPKCGSETVEHRPTQFFAQTSKKS